MPIESPREQLASIAAVTSDLDELLDKLFANVAELKAVLASAGADVARGKAGADDQHTGPA